MTTRKERARVHVPGREGRAAFSLVETLVALGIGMVFIVLVRGSLGENLEATAHIREYEDLETIKMTIVERLDCGTSLGVVSMDSGPLDCAAYGDVPLRRRAFTASGALVPAGELITDASGKLGAWTVKAACRSNRLVIAASKPGVDPLTKKPWTSLPLATDLFAGVSDFCREFFEQGPSKCIVATRSVRNGYGALTYLGRPTDAAISFDCAASPRDCWGVRCKLPFRRTGCTLWTEGSFNTGQPPPPGADLRLVAGDGCSSTAATWDAKSYLHVTCCDLGQ